MVLEDAAGKWVIPQATRRATLKERTVSVIKEQIGGGHHGGYRPWTQSLRARCVLAITMLLISTRVPFDPAAPHHVQQRPFLTPARRSQPRPGKRGSTS